MTSVTKTPDQIMEEYLLSIGFVKMTHTPVPPTAVVVQPQSDLQPLIFSSRWRYSDAL
jgi:hypothetical protein